MAAEDEGRRASWSSPGSPAARRRYGVAILLVTVFGLWLRLDGLTAHTVGHNEIYIPGIDLPDAVSIPPSRYSPAEVVFSTIHSEPHPPGFYLAMLPWTRTFGTSALSLRLPTAILGGLLAGLIGLLGMGLGRPASGLMAAVLWALLPQSIALDQIARMYTPATALGVGATILLLSTYGARAYRGLLLAGYLLVSAVGLSMTVFYWPILLAHSLFVLLGPRTDGNTPPWQLRWQLWLATLASPLITVALYQSGRESYLIPRPFADLYRYVQLFYSFPDRSLGVSPVTAESVWGMALAALVVGLVIAAARRAAAAPAAATEGGGRVDSLPQWLMAASALFAFVAIAGFIYVSGLFENYFEDRTSLLVASAPLPLVIVGAELLARRRWGSLRRRLDATIDAPLPLTWLVVITAVVPIAAIALATAVATPLFAPRTAYPAAPYLVLAASLGATSLTKPRIAPVFAFALLLTAAVAGHWSYEERFVEPRDYKSLAEQLEPLSRDTDLWFVFKDWTTTPVFYYLDADRELLVGTDYAEAAANRPGSRVWTIVVEGVGSPAELTESLRDHRFVERVRARGLYADLYEPVDGRSPR